MAEPYRCMFASFYSDVFAIVVWSDCYWYELLLVVCHAPRLGVLTTLWYTHGWRLLFLHFHILSLFQVLFLVPIIVVLYVYNNCVNHQGFTVSSLHYNLSFVCFCNIFHCVASKPFTHTFSAFLCLGIRTWKVHTRVCAN